MSLYILKDCHKEYYRQINPNSLSKRDYHDTSRPSSHVCCVLQGRCQAQASTNSRNTLWKLIYSIPQSSTTTQHLLNLIIVVTGNCKTIRCMEVYAFPLGVHWRDWMEIMPFPEPSSTRLSTSSGSTATHVVPESSLITDLHSLLYSMEAKGKLQVGMRWPNGTWSG